MNIGTWEKAEELVPEEIDREMLLPFTEIPLQQVPQQLRDYCNLLSGKTDVSITGSDPGISVGRAKGRLIAADARELDVSKLGLSDEFPGFRLIVLNTPQVSFRMSLQVDLA